MSWVVFLLFRFNLTLVFCLILSDKADKENTNTVNYDLIALMLANLTVMVVDLTVITGYLILIFQSTFEKKVF